jgi:SAM-dependent methyltransferase
MIEIKSSAQPDDWDRHWHALESANIINPAQEYRRHLIRENLCLDPATARVLDIGSGVGEFLRVLHIQHAGIPKLGLEMSHCGVEIASHRLPQALFLQRDLVFGNDDPKEHRGFATHAVCSEVLEHVDDPGRLLRNARAYMADGCRLIVTVPGGPQSRFDKYIGHRRHYTPSDIRKVLTDAGFTVEFATGAGFPFFNLYRLLVILRGQWLVNDASGPPGISLRIASSIFRILFNLNIARSGLGWQTIAVAIK